MKDRNQIHRKPACEALRTSAAERKFLNEQTGEPLRKFYEEELLPLIMGNPACLTPAQIRIVEDRAEAILGYENDGEDVNIATHRLNEDRKLQLATYINSVRPLCKACTQQGNCRQEDLLKG